MIIKYLQKNVPPDNKLLETLACPNPREHKSSNSVEFTRLAHGIPSITDEEEIKVGGDWFRYQGSEIHDDDFVKDLLIISGIGSSVILTNVDTFLKFILKR